MAAVGIDFGTSNSSVAVVVDGQVRLLALDAGARDVRVMRSLLYITRDGDILAGQRALETYSTQNTGREVILERRIVGEISMTFSDVGTQTGTVVAEIDANEPGRLFQSLKRFLPDTSFTATDVFGEAYSIEQLTGTLAAKIVAAAEADLGERLTDVVVGRPVRFSTEPDKDALALRRLTDAWRFAGVENVSFLEEPVAALHHFASTQQWEADRPALVFDFGGGTLDITVARNESGAVRVLATTGIPLGGDRIDSRIMESLIVPVFGEDARYRHTGLPLPVHLFARLQTWQSILELNRPELLNLIRRAQHNTDRPQELARLEALVTRNYGFELFRSVEAAKISLTEREAAVVELVRTGIDVRQPITRSEFEAAIRVLVREAQAIVLEALNDAGLAPEDIGVVVTTGGSSLIPAFRSMLRVVLPRARLQESDAFTSVAAGLALSAATTAG